MVDMNSQNEEDLGKRQTLATSMPMCPMGETCKSLIERPSSSFLMFIPGIVFIVVGVLIIIEPSILVWLIAAASILLGIAMLGGAYFMRSASARLMGAHR